MSGGSADGLRRPQGHLTAAQKSAEGVVGHLGGDDPTLADAILDRVVHNAHRIHLRGESLRRKKAQENVMA